MVFPVAPINYIQDEFDIYIKNQLVILKINYLNKNIESEDNYFKMSHGFIFSVFFCNF